jgi:uncharacterized membrane protein
MVYATRVARSEIITELLGRDLGRLQEDIDSIQQEMRRLEAEEQLLRQVLAMQKLTQQDSEQQSRPVATRATSPKPAPPTASTGSRPSVSGTVLEVVQADPGTWMNYAQAHEALSRRGVKATRNTVRVAIRRWAERGALEFDGQRFRASPNAAASNPFMGGEGEP